MPVIGRALAFLAMRAAAEDAPEKMRNLQQRAKFLEGLGISRADVATMLGTTAASISELHRRAKGSRS